MSATADDHEQPHQDWKPSGDFGSIHPSGPRPSGTTRPLPDLDVPPQAAGEIVAFALRERFAGIGPSSEAFRLIVFASFLIATILATTLGLVGQLIAVCGAVVVWTCCVRIHVSPINRAWVYATEAVVIALLLLVS